MSTHPMRHRRSLVPPAMVTAALGLSVVAQAAGPDPASLETAADAEAVDLLAAQTPEDLAAAQRAREAEYGAWLSITAFYPNQANRLWLSAGGESGARPASGYHAGALQHGHDGHEAFEPGDPRGCWDCHQDPAYGHGGLDAAWAYGGGAPFSMGVDLAQAREDYHKARTRTLHIRAARDEDYLYLHARWPSQTDASGAGRDEPGPSITHQTYRWDAEAGAFRDRGGQRSAGPEEAGPVTAEDLGPGGRMDYEERLVAMLAPAADPVTDELGGAVSGDFNAQGCFMACHDDLRNMPGAQALDEAAVAGTLLEGESDLRHYTLNSRDLDGASPSGYRLGTELAERYAGGDTAALAESLAEGAFLDLLQVRMGRSAPMGHASSDYVYHYRAGNNALVGGEGGFAPAGRANWHNQDPGDGVPGDAHLRYIYDPRETGFWGLDPEHLAAHKRRGEGPLIIGADHPQRNAIDLAEDDHLVAWEDGAFVLQRDFGPHGDAGDRLAEVLDDGALVPRRALVEAEGARKTTRAFAQWQPAPDGGVFDVFVARPLEPGGGEADVPGAVTDHDLGAALEEAGLTLGLGVHDDHTGNRSHHVTLPVGLVAEGERRAYAEAVAERYAADPATLAERLPIIEVAEP